MIPSPLNDRARFRSRNRRVTRALLVAAGLVVGVNTAGAQELCGRRAGDVVAVPAGRSGCSSSADLHQPVSSPAPEADGNVGAAPFDPGYLVALGTVFGLVGVALSEIVGASRPRRPFGRSRGRRSPFKPTASRSSFLGLHMPSRR